MYTAVPGNEWGDLLVNPKPSSHAYGSQHAQVMFINPETFLTFNAAQSWTPSSYMA